MIAFGKIVDETPKGKGEALNLYENF